MINAWSLLYEELNGTMAKTYPIKDDSMSPCKLDTKITSLESDEYDPIITVGSGNTASAYASEFNIDLSGINSISLNTDEIDFGTPFAGGMSEDCITFGSTVTDSAPYTIPVPDAFGYNDQVDTLVDSMGDVSKPQPDLKYKSQKYQEDKGIADLKDYVSSTYKGHYTNENSDTQTLDLIHSVGDAESFCRSNALKYLSRYDKKGSAKNDILKAMHYCLLLYYFSGNTKEPEYTNTRYETF